MTAKKKKKRKFKITTPGQIRDFEVLVKNRGFQRYEDVTTETAIPGVPVNSVADGGVDMAPNAGRATKVFMKRKRKTHVDLDGRTRLYRDVGKRIKNRRHKAQVREINKKFAMWGAHTNPFVKEDTKMDDKKYLDTKKGSIEDAVVQSLQTEMPENPNTQRPILHLPKKKYFQSKEESLEWSAIKTLAEKQSFPDEGEPKKIQNKDNRKKLDKVDSKELKGKHKERDDKDIDNDGDIDKSDQYLHRRRKNISQRYKELKRRARHTQYDLARAKRASDDVDKVGESKEVDAGERDAGSDAYTNYTKALTPGQSISDVDAKKADVRKKKEQAVQHHQATVIDDEYHFGSIDEAEKWIKKAIKRPGALHRDLDVPQGEKIPVSKIKAAAKGDGKVAQRARLALTLRGMNKEEVEIDEKSWGVRDTSGQKGWGAHEVGTLKRHKNVKRERKPRDIPRGMVPPMMGTVDAEEGKDYKVKVIGRTPVDVQQLKPSLKGMPLKQRKLLRNREKFAKKLAKQKTPHKAGEPLIK
tara:strand:+ start:2475 stop:4052 length:1578 start_codon:yes stop_codon:yes gene_type:complete